MQCLKLSQVRLRYKIAIVILASLYLIISAITNKLKITSYLDTEFQDLENIYHLLRNQSIVIGDTSRLEILNLFSAAASSLNVEVILIEPSILFNLLSKQQQDFLLKRGSNRADFNYIPGMVTFGYFDEYRKYITLAEFQRQMLLKGFSYINLNDSCRHVSSQDSSHSGHHFFMTHKWKIHLVEFVRKSSYLLHSALPVHNCSSLINQPLYFAAYDGIFENFKGIVINEESKLTVPPRPLRFLHEMKTSKFLRCRDLLQPGKKHPRESEVGNLIPEMKTILYPNLYDFWLTSGTLLGWYRECGIIPYTTDIDFGMRASDVKSLGSILKVFRNSKVLRLVERYGLVEEALEFTLDYKGLRVDVFYFYEEKNQSYVACHFKNKKSYAKVLYPPFSLCSADFMGQKVLVPCDTETILRTEYGPNWTQPVSNWDWKSSFFNKGPEIKWDDNKKKKVHQYFRH